MVNRWLTYCLMKIMSTQNILQPIDVNSVSMDGSPAKKKARYESPVHKRWSLSQKTVKLDEVFDCGVAVLESDSDTQSDDECHKEQFLCQDEVISTTQEITKYLCHPTIDSKECNSNDSKITCPTPESIQNDSPVEDKVAKLGEWEEVIANKEVIPYRNDDCNIDYFSSLSDEVILHIFHFLPKRQLAHLACVCSRFNCLTKDESLWTRLDVSNRVLRKGVLGIILSRQVVILRLAQSEILYPGILPDCRASNDDFQARLLYLDLSMAHISLPCLAKLFSKCKRLKKLSLEHVTVDDEVMAMLSRNTELEVLNLAMVIGLQKVGLHSLLSNCRKLRELNLAWTFLTCDSINYVCRNLPKTLDRLNISGCRKLLNDNNVLDLVNSCKEIRELDLSDCTGLTNSAIEHIVLFPNLNFLALSRCYLILAQPLLLLKKCPSLLYLEIHGGYIKPLELQKIQECLGSHVQINTFMFSSVARPTVGSKRTSIWNLRVRD